MVGDIDDVSKSTPQPFQNAGDDIVLLGSNTGELGGSEYLYVTADLVAGRPPSVDLQGERMLQQAVLLMNHEGLLTSAHDCSDGGLASALAECALGNGEAPLGVEAELDDQLRPVVALFGESHGRIIVSCAQDKTEEVLRLAERHDVPARRIGRVAGEGEGFVLKVRDGVIKAPIAELADAYFGAIPKIMDATPPSGD
jgi:phosphoribosylformylglycinamidine synthase